MCFWEAGQSPHSTFSKVQIASSPSFGSYWGLSSTMYHPYIILRKMAKVHQAMAVLCQVVRGWLRCLLGLLVKSRGWRERKWVVIMWRIVMTTSRMGSFPSPDLLKCRNSSQHLCCYSWFQWIITQSSYQCEEEEREVNRKDKEGMSTCNIQLSKNWDLRKRMMTVCKLGTFWTFATNVISICPAVKNCVHPTIAAAQKIFIAISNQHHIYKCVSQILEIHLSFHSTPGLSSMHCSGPAAHHLRLMKMMDWWLLLCTDQKEVTIKGITRKGITIKRSNNIELLKSKLLQIELPKGQLKIDLLKW